MVTDLRKPDPNSMFELLINDREILIQAWMKRVREDERIPSANELTSTLLRDHFPQLLNQIVLALAKHRSGVLETEAAVEGVSTSDAAREHINMRFLSGYTLIETLRELSHLRTEIVRRWSDSKLRPTPDELEILHASFDEVMSAAADEIHARMTAAKDVFHARLSHELSTPVTAIIGCVETLRSADKESEHFLRCIDLLSRNAELMVATVENLRDLSEMIFGRFRFGFRDCDANEVAKLAAETVHAISVDKAVDIVLKLEPSARHFIADPVKLHQALLNVLNNALKFTPKGGTVSLECRSTDEIVEFTVSDTGEGIAPDFLPYVFEQFRQESPTNRTHGLGIGLAITREIIENHGGRITAESPGKGLGAAFRIMLPVRSATH